MDKTTLNEHLVTNRQKRGFYHLKAAVDQMCGKILVANERNDQLDFAAC